MAIVRVKLLILPPYFYHKDKKIILPLVSSVFIVGLFILKATSCLTMGSVDTIYHDLIYPWAACIGAPYSALPLHSWLHHSEHSYCFSCQPLGEFFFPPSTHIDNSLSRYLGTCPLSALQVTGCPPALIQHTYQTFG